MKLRKVVEDATRIQPIQHGVEPIVSVTDDVIDTVILDETYIFRVSCGVEQRLALGLTIKNHMLGAYECESSHEQNRIRSC